MHGFLFSSFYIFIQLTIEHLPEFFIIYLISWEKTGILPAFGVGAENRRVLLQKAAFLFWADGNKIGGNGYEKNYQQCGAGGE